MPPSAAETLTSEARFALGEVYRLLASIGAREDSDAVVGETTAREAEGGDRAGGRQPST